ncbi:hypothetical protein B296_00028699 [Ensete ventricosum]|uniref:Uncharacterized protein n=1 Tax=Ensete ventricosum TaxID=4639 RepID=A0A427A6L4_ENSVE|nr:hypothetical protein B296_00028699 [Ensete ventricosum]
MWSGAHREFARGRPGFSRCDLVLVESLSEVGRGSDEVVGSSSSVLQRFVGKFVRSSPIGYQELIGSSSKGCWSSSGVHRRRSGAYQGFTGRMLGVCREIN